MNVELQLVFKGHAPRHLRVRRPAVMRVELTPERAAFMMDDPVRWPEWGWLHRLDPRSARLCAVEVYSAGQLVATLVKDDKVCTRGTVTVQWFRPVCWVSLTTPTGSRMEPFALKLLGGADADA